MKLRTTLASIFGALALAAAAAYAPAAFADRVGFNVTLGGPGYAVNFGNAGYGYYDAWRPAPVVVAPYAPYYAPYRTYYRPYYPPYYAPVVVRPYPVYRGYQGDRYHRHGDRNHGRGYRHHDHRR